MSPTTPDPMIDAVARTLWDICEIADDTGDPIPWSEDTPGYWQAQKDIATGQARRLVDALRERGVRVEMAEKEARW